MIDYSEKLIIRITSDKTRLLPVYYDHEKEVPTMIRWNIRNAVEELNRAENHHLPLRKRYHRSMVSRRLICF